MRVYPADNLQGTTLAQLTRTAAPSGVRARRPRDRLLRSDRQRVRQPSRRLGSRSPSRVKWNTAKRDQSKLTDRVARSGADAVLVSSIMINNAGHMIRALRERLQQQHRRAAATASPRRAAQAAAGRSAIGMFLTTSGFPVEALPPAGAAFARRFAPRRPASPSRRTRSTPRTRPTSCSTRSRAPTASVARHQGIVPVSTSPTVSPVRPTSTAPQHRRQRGHDRRHRRARLEQPSDLRGQRIERVARLSPELLEPSIGRTPSCADSCSRGLGRDRSRTARIEGSGSGSDGDV